MKLFTFSLGLLGLVVSPVVSIVLKAPNQPVPAAPSAKLPTPRLNDIPCEKFEACLAEQDASNKTKASADHTEGVAALKACVMKSLGKEQGEKAWAIFTNAAPAKKPSLALLKTSLKQLSDLCHIVDPPKMANQPVAGRPKVTDAVLPTPHMDVKDMTCQKWEACLAEQGSDKNAKDVAALKTCVMKSLGEEQGKKAWDIFSKATQDSHKKLSMAAVKTSVQQLTNLCLIVAPPKKPVNQPVHVEVPATPAVKLAQPGSGTPASCQKLDACLAGLDQGKSQQGFEGCVQNFCKELHGKKKFEGKDDPRTALCDEKGQKAWKIFADARKDAKKVMLKGEAKASFISVKTEYPKAYDTALHLFFSEQTSAADMEHACRI